MPMKRKPMGKHSRQPEQGAEEMVAAGVLSHATFFDELVELAPAKFYIPIRRDDEWLRYRHSKSEKAAAKQARKENSKKAKRLKLDPEQALTTTEAIVKFSAEDGKDSESENSEDDDGEDSDGEMQTEQQARAKGGGLGGGGGGDFKQKAGAPPLPLVWSLKDGSNRASKEELAERLRKKIEAARAGRKAEARVLQAKSAQQWRSQATAKAKPHDNNQKRNKQATAPETGSTTPAPVQVNGKESLESIQTSRVDSGKQKHQTKVLAKSKMLEKAEAVAAVVAEGGAKADNHAWSAAMKRASGEKVLDDPKLLRKTLKREEKRKQKSSEKWEKKLALQKDTRDAKQSKRNSNIKARKDSVRDKRQERRDKKLLRPGFEGRKSGFLNKE